MSSLMTASPVPKGMVYILECGSWVEDGLPYYKLGRTDSGGISAVRSRVQSMATAVPHPIGIVFTAKVGDSAAVEAEVHSHFRSRRCDYGGGTEFFKITKEEGLEYFRSRGIANEIVGVEYHRPCDPWIPLIGHVFTNYDEIREVLFGVKRRVVDGVELTRSELKKRCRGMEAKEEVMVVIYADSEELRLRSRPR